MIADLLDPEAVFPHVVVDDADALLVMLGEQLQRLGAVGPGFIDAVLEREHSMPTGLELGGEHNIAIPHADPEHVVEQCMALATTAEPVVFRNMGDREAEVPVRVVLLLALTDPNGHIEVLRQIATVLSSPEQVDRLVVPTTKADLIAAIEAVFSTAEAGSS